MFGHEDWDLVLQMAERGIEGEAAESATFMYRKRGFSRVNAVEYGPKSFHERISRRHPLLYGRRRKQIKAEWAPALSLVLVNDCGNLNTDDLAERLRKQSCPDFETVCVGFTMNRALELCVQEIAGEGLEPLRAAVEGARGRFVIIATRDAAEALSRSTFVEQMIRLFWGNGKLLRLVLAAEPNRRRPRLSLLTAREASGATPCAVAWRRGEDECYKVKIGDTGSPIEDVMMQWHIEAPVEWRSI